MPFCKILLLLCTILFAQARIDLDKGWTISNKNGSIILPDISVPSTVHMALKNAGKISEPYFRFNDVELRWIAKDDWSYTYTFSQATIDTLLSRNLPVFLVCEGLDTVATIRVNNKIVASTNNMFRRYIFDIRSALQDASGQNTVTLRIEFESAISYAAAQSSQYPYSLPTVDDPVQHGEPHRNMIRKEQCSFSWDWGPCFATMGIHKPIYIIQIESAKVLDIAPQVFLKEYTSPTTGNFDVKIKTNILAIKALSAKVQFTIPTHADYSETVNLIPGENELVVTLPCDNVKMWFPRGYGSQQLYTLKITLFDETGSYSETKRIGFKSAKIIQKPVANGALFYFEINGLPIFSKGANYIPPDAFADRMTPDLYRQTVISAIDVNMNTLRVWGGGQYAPDAFYDACDELGILVWQEFMFACAVYPRDDAFLNNVAEEVKYQIRRLSHHVSIMLWSGNNENEASLWDNTWYAPAITAQNKTVYYVDYAQLYFNTIRTTLLKEDKSREFWPSSPSKGFLVDGDGDFFVGKWVNPYTGDSGDVHYYNYFAPCTDIRTFPKARFMSEYGFQSFDSFATIKSVSTSEDWSYDSDLMNHRQHHRNGTNEILGMIQRYFKFTPGKGVAKYLQFIYLSQALQSICMRAQSEYYRALRGDETVQTMGALYWQHNAYWQAPSWSSQEYSLTKLKYKMMHYHVKEFFSDLHVISFENFDTHEYSIHVANDLNEKVDGNVTLVAINYQTGTTQVVKYIKFEAEPLSSKKILSSTIDSVLPSGLCPSRRDCMLRLRLYRTNKNVYEAENHFYPSTFAEAKLNKATVKLVSAQNISPTQVALTIRTDAPALFVWLEYENYDLGRFSANGLTIVPSEEKVIYFNAWDAFTVLDAQDILSKTKVTTLSDFE